MIEMRGEAILVEAPVLSLDLAGIGLELLDDPDRRYS
jgi:hypothetical protein